MEGHFLRIIKVYCFVNLAAAYFINPIKNPKKGSLKFHTKFCLPGRRQVKKKK